MLCPLFGSHHSQTYLSNIIHALPPVRKPSFSNISFKHYSCSAPCSEAIILKHIFQTLFMLCPLFGRNHSQTYLSNIIHALPPVRTQSFSNISFKHYSCSAPCSDAIILKHIFQTLFMLCPLFGRNHSQTYLSN